MPDRETSDGDHDTIESVDHAAPNHNIAAAGTGSRMDGNGGYSSHAPEANNVVHQRRRVNPESLALRLGPDLVRDLDALITPGNTEMPSFAVRKELQERYSIDRRHIYDYFHSKGLRVVKEDKHGNPAPAKDLPTTPLPNLRPQRQAPTRSHLPYPLAAERKLFKPRGVTKAKPGRPKKNQSADPKIIPITREISESTDTNASVSEHSSPDAVPDPTYIAVNPLLPRNPTMEEDENYTFNSATNPLDETFSVSRAIGDITYAYQHKSVFERMQELTECPVKMAPVEGQSLSWNETSPCFASAKGLLLPHAKPLTPDERHMIYETLSESLGPAHGIQECQGTYRKHMEARTKLYFEGLLPVPYHHAQQPARTSTLLDRKLSLGTNEFRHWLSETRFLKRDSHRNTNVAKSQDVDGAIDKQFKQRSIVHWLQSLDDLFPTPGDNWIIDDLLTDSPIVRSRVVTRMAPHARYVINEHNTGDRPLFSVIASPNLSIPPVPSVTETRQVGQPQFHGLSGFSGSQDVKIRTLVAEMDSHPQWLEDDSHVTHPGQHLTLSDTLRRSRNNARNRIPSRSPRKPHMRDLDRIRTRPVTSRDARRRTTSVAGDI